MAFEGFTTIYKEGEGYYEEKKSRFLGFIYHVSSEDDVSEILKPMKKKFWDSRHICYAYILGSDGSKQKFSDDGEPSGTAGKPILDVLSGRGLSDTLAVVVRYFGGVLLGTGGLVRAYHEACADALNNATLIEMYSGRMFTISLDYTTYGKLTYYLNQENITVLSTDYADAVTLKFPVPNADVSRVEADITDMTGGSCPIEKSDIISYGVTDDGIITDEN